MLTRKLIERSDCFGSWLFNPKDSKGIPIYLGISGRESICTASQWKGFKGQVGKHRLKKGILGSRLNSDEVAVLGLECGRVGLQAGSWVV